MTTQAHTEAESTRALWREYRKVSTIIQACARGHAEWLCEPENVGRVVRLLREQKRILNELIPEEK